jgi:kynurenine formamidase
MLIDLSHTIEHGMITCNGLPAPIVCDYPSREVGRFFAVPVKDKGMGTFPVRAFGIAGGI